ADAVRLEGLEGTLTSRMTFTASDSTLLPQRSEAVACRALGPGANSTGAEKRPSAPAATAAPEAAPLTRTCTLLPGRAMPLTTSSALRVLRPAAGDEMRGASGAALATCTWKSCRLKLPSESVARTDKT